MLCDDNCSIGSSSDESDDKTIGFFTGSVDLRSLYADDNGVWQTSSPKTYLRVFLQNGKVDNVEMGNPIDYTHRLKRQYGKHQAWYVVLPV
jgi:hypothetical protein